MLPTKGMARRWVFCGVKGKTDADGRVCWVERAKEMVCCKVTSRRRLEVRVYCEITFEREVEGSICCVLILGNIRINGVQYINSHRKVDLRAY